MTLLRAPGTWASGAPRITPIAVFGSVRRPDGELADVVPDEGRLRKALSSPPSESGLEALVLATADVLAADLRSTEWPIAYLAIGVGPALSDCDLDWRKGDFDEDEHPRWPKGSPDRLSGEFRDKDKSDADEQAARKKRLADRVRRLAVRRAAREAAVTALTVGREAALNAIPVVGEIADLKIVLDLGILVAECGELAIEINAAIDYIKAGRHTLDELRVSQEDQSFTSFRGLKAHLGSALSGNQYHHIVEQSAIDGEGISARAVHNSENVLRIPTLLHEAINSVYSGPSPDDPSLTVREWLRGQSYQAQRDYGIKVMQDLGIIQ